MIVEEKPKEKGKGKEKEKDRIVYVQTVMPESELLKLKIRTGETQTKEAVSKAIAAYLAEE